MGFSTGGSGSETTPVPIISSDQARILEALTDWIYPQIGQPGPVYEGDLVPGASPLQEYGFNALTQQNPLMGDYQSALSTMLGGGPAYEIDPSARQAVYEAGEAQSMRDWRTKILPTLEERWNMRDGARSGGLAQALGQSGVDLTLGLGSQRAGLEYADEMARRQAMESGAGRQLAGLGAYQGGQQMDLSRLATLLGAGEMQREISGQLMQEPYRQWVQGQPAANPLLQHLPLLLGTQVYAPGTSSWGFSTSIA